MRKVLVLGLMFGMVAVWNTACSGDDDDDDGHEAPVSIAVTGGTTVTVGSTLQLTATATYDDGSTGDVTSGAEGSTWTTNSAANATVGAATGLVTGVSSGPATITATHDGIAGSITLTVSTGSAATFNGIVNGDAGWGANHANGTTIFARIVDTAGAAVVDCQTTTVTAGVFTVTATGKLTAGHTYFAEAVADVGASGDVSASDHKWRSANFGPVGANATTTITHGTTASTWANGVACP